MLNKKERASIPNKLKFYRQKIGLSQAKLAQMVSVSETHYQNIEYGKTMPSILIVLLLAKALDEKVEDLFTLPSDETSTSEK